MPSTSRPFEVLEGAYRGLGGIGEVPGLVAGNVEAERLEPELEIAYRLAAMAAAEIDHAR